MNSRPSWPIFVIVFSSQALMLAGICENQPCLCDVPSVCCLRCRSQTGVVIGMSGVSVLETEARGDKLWVPDSSRAQDDYVSSKQKNRTACTVAARLVVDGCGRCMCAGSWYGSLSASRGCSSDEHGRLSGSCACSSWLGLGLSHATCSQNTCSPTTQFFQ